MSDNESDKGESANKTDKKGPVFTEKEEMVLKAAWRCLKSGPPEASHQHLMFLRIELTKDQIDMGKLMVAAGFNTMKTTANTWGRSWTFTMPTLRRSC